MQVDAAEGQGAQADGNGLLGVGIEADLIAGSIHGSSSGGGYHSKSGGQRAVVLFINTSSHIVVGWLVSPLAG